MKLWTRADYDAATAHDAAQRAHDDARRAWETPMPPQTDPWADDHGQGATPRPWTPEDDALDAACDAASGLLQAGRGNTPPTPPTTPYACAVQCHDLECKDCHEDAAREGAEHDAEQDADQAAPTTPKKPTTPTAPTAPTLLETLVSDYGVEVAFRVWAQRRTPTPCQPALWDAQRVLADAQEAEKDAIASLAEARLARRAAAADLAEARAKVAVERARIARGRVG